MRIITFFISLCILSGCAGTFSTRSNGDTFGKYPYSAITYDVTNPQQIPSSGILVISFPVDLILDTVLLPFDLILWPFGYQKIIDTGPTAGP